MKRTHSDLEVLRRANPVRDDDVAKAVEGDAAEQMLRSIVATPRSLSDRHRARKRLWIPSLVSGVALAIAFALMLSSSRTPSEDAPATLALEEVAEVAAARELAPMSGRFRYTSSEGGHLASLAFATPVREEGQASSTAAPSEVTAFVTNEREIWIAPDGSGRLKVAESDPIFLGPEDRRRWEDLDKPSFGLENTDDRFDKGGLTYEDFSGLPDDEDALYEEIERRARESAGDGLRPQMFNVIADLLRETAAPPELRADLYRVIARIPGVTVDEEATDERGRHGTAAAIEYDHAGRVLQEIIFDPETSDLLGMRETLLEEVEWVDAEADTVIGYTNYLTEGYVDSVDERP